MQSSDLPTRRFESKLADLALALVRLCMINGTKNGQKSVSFSGHISDGLSVVLV